MEQIEKVWSRVGAARATWSTDMDKGATGVDSSEEGESEHSCVNCREELMLFYVDCPEKVSWELNINGTKFAGRKSIVTGNKFRLEVHMDLFPNEVLQEKRDEIEREGRRQTYVKMAPWGKKK